MAGMEIVTGMKMSVKTERLLQQGFVYTGKNI
jgi:hypothetical protein